MTSPITPERVREIIAAYGAAAQRWPQSERDAALALIAADPGLARLRAQARGLDAVRASVGARESHDQWTVANGFDAHRPLYRVALNDAADTMLYVSSVTGEVVLDTRRFERTWNWAGSVLHWIYPTALRQHWTAMRGLRTSMASSSDAIILRPSSITRRLGGWRWTCSGLPRPRRR